MSDKPKFAQGRLEAVFIEEGLYHIHSPREGRHNPVPLAVVDHHRDGDEYTRTTLTAGNAAELVRRWNAFEEGGAVEEMYAALEALLECHSCDTGEVDYKAEWEGDHTVCDACKPAHTALRHAKGEL